MMMNGHQIISCLLSRKVSTYSIYLETTRQSGPVKRRSCGSIHINLATPEVAPELIFFTFYICNFVIIICIYWDFSLLFYPVHTTFKHGHPGRGILPVKGFFGGCLSF